MPCGHFCNLKEIDKMDAYLIVEAVKDLTNKIKRSNQIKRLQLDFDIVKYHNSISRHPSPITRTEQNNLDIFTNKYNEVFNDS